jgi:hypothetical protein
MTVLVGVSYVVASPVSRRIPAYQEVLRRSRIDAAHALAVMTARADPQPGSCSRRRECGTTAWIAVNSS